MEWLAVSKAFDKSIEKPNAYILSSKDSWIRFANSIIACSAEWPNWKRNYFEHRHFWMDDYALFFKEFWKGKKRQNTEDSKLVAHEQFWTSPETP